MSTFDITAVFKTIITNSGGVALRVQEATLLVGPDNKEYLQGPNLRFEVPTGTISSIATHLKSKKEQEIHFVSYDDVVVTFEVLIERQLRGSQSIQFSKIIQSSKNEILGALGVEVSSILGHALLAPRSNQRLIIATPTRECALAIHLVVSKFVSAEVITDSSPKTSSRAVIMVADDLVTLLMKWRSLGEGDVLSSIARVKANCSFCSRSAKPDLGLVHQLPEVCQQMSLAQYQIGRGCERCAHSGVMREQWIDSTIVVGASLVEMMKGRLVESLLAEEITGLGGASLIEKLFKKVSSGELSLESMIQSLGAALSRPSILFSIGHNPKTKAQVAAVNGARRVLIVEDDIDQAEILSLVLQQSSFEVVMAHDGNEGLKALDEGHFDLVISDLMMPRMDGVQFVSQIRKKNSAIPILILTVLGDEERECALLALGADDYCAKTIHKRTLIKRIEALLRRSAAQKSI